MAAPKAKTGAVASDTKGIEPEGSHPRATDEDDVEGHNMGQNVMLSRGAQASREHDIQRKIKQQDLEAQARRPHQKDGR